MCAIIASFNPQKLKELAELNEYRGALNYSLTMFKLDKPLQITNLWRGEGGYPEDTWDLLWEENYYYIGHTQAPTTQSGGLQPYSFDGTLLWHNGIIKQKEIQEGEWDTSYLSQQIFNRGYQVLSVIDGSFACMYYDRGDILLFRNEISPLFIDDELSVSSTKFEGSTPLPPNKVFVINWHNKTISEKRTFFTKENPYYIPE